MGIHTNTIIFSSRISLATKYFIIFFWSDPSREIREKNALKVEKIDLQREALPGRRGIWSFWRGGPRLSGSINLCSKVTPIYPKVEKFQNSGTSPWGHNPGFFLSNAPQKVRIMGHLDSPGILLYTFMYELCSTTRETLYNLCRKV